jgi:cytochrome b
MKPGEDGSAAGRQVTVWDLGVRVFHWLLVLSVIICAFTGFLAPRNWLDLHLILGCVIAALIIFRLVWGWLGSRYARFASFPISPEGIARHLLEIIEKRPHPELGHNPLGALMVYGLLLVLSLIIATGVVALGGVVKQGPLAFLASYAVGSPTRQLHQLLAIALLVMIGLHLAGVAFESRRSGSNLVRAMITGHKAANALQTVSGNGGHPRLAALVLVLLGVIIVPAVVGLAALPGRGVPPAGLDPTYAKECGSCHLAYPPSLAPASSWVAVMQGLPDHFGEDASLDPATTKKIAEWLVANASEQWDTRPANIFRLRATDDPMRITATPAWIRIHRHIPDAAFKMKSVGAKGACAACHEDAASGRFDPQSISMPEEAE